MKHCITRTFYLEGNPQSELNLAGSSCPYGRISSHLRLYRGERSLALTLLRSNSLLTGKLGKIFFGVLDAHRSDGDPTPDFGILALGCERLGVLHPVFRWCCWRKVEWIVWAALSSSPVTCM